MLGVHTRAVVRLALDELGCCRQARQAEHVQTSGCGLTVGSQRRPARDHRVCEPVHMQPVLLEQIVVVTQCLGARSFSAVDEEVHAGQI
jgi:hypothetical protein